MVRAGKAGQGNGPVVARGAGDWAAIGTVVGNTTTYEFTFILESYRARVGDLVAVRMEIPSDDYDEQKPVVAWGRITGIERFTPSVPQGTAQELAGGGVPPEGGVPAAGRDYLQAEVLILGITVDGDVYDQLLPLTYPIQPAADVLRPPAEAVQRLLGGGQPGQAELNVGTLLSRSDVPVTLSGDRVVSRHMAILAMTGGGKTVAARRILVELMRLRYPIVIFDPHGDYIGLWQAHQKGSPLLAGSDIKLFYPHIAMNPDNQEIVEVLLAKMTEGLTEPQREFLSELLHEWPCPQAGTSVLAYLQDLIVRFEVSIEAQKEADRRRLPTMQAVRRSLVLVRDRLQKMEATNEQMRRTLKDFQFEQLPDPQSRPEGIVRPGQVSILYLGGYDHLTQSTIVSIVMEALFNHRAALTNRIAPFLSVVEEAHNFIPSVREGDSETPSLPTLRKVITEGRKFGTGLLLITQRPSRVDETILAQCNSFLVLRLVNPKDHAFVRSVMENMSEADAKLLPGFGPGQGLVSGQAVRFSLLVQVTMDRELVSTSIGDESFIAQAAEWQPAHKWEGC
jgi:hypothetical protein